MLPAPFAGRVSHRMIDEGTVVAAGNPVIELLDDDHLEAWVGLSTSATANLRVGQTQSLRVDGKTVASQIYSLAPDVDRSTRTQNVIFRLATGSQGVLPGQVVRVDIDEPSDNPVIGCLPLH